MSLRTQLRDAKARITEVHAEIESVGATAEAEGRDLTEADSAIVQALSDEFDKLEATAKLLTGHIAHADKVAASKVADIEVQGAGVVPSGAIEHASNAALLPARVRSQKSKVYDKLGDCYAVGQWLAGLFGNSQSKQWATDHGMSYRNAMEEGTTTAGGFAVPDPMAATIIRLVEDFGIFRQFSRNIPMTSDTLAVPKRAAGLTVYYPNEGSAITPSDLTFGQVNLTAKKYAQLSIMSTELNEDSIISMTDLLTTEQAYAFALAEDTNSFLGDGTATYAGITGIANALAAGSLVAGGAGLWGGIDLTTLESMVGMTPAYAGFEGRWFMSKYAYFTVVNSLLNAAGGTDMRQIEQGGEMMLLGYPVTFTQVLPGANAANGDLVAVFGDLSQGSYLGNRRNVSLRLLTELYAASDQIGIVGTLRSDTQIHDVGDATNAGAIVGLTLTT